MNKDEKIEEIDRKCRMAGCSEEKAKRHLRMFVYERWDVHPPQDFRDWILESWERDEVRRQEVWATQQEHRRAAGQDEMPFTPIEKPNVITTWNSAPTRDEFKQIRSGEL